MTLVVAQEVPTSSSMAVPHGPAGVGQARHRMREQLRSHGVSDSVVDDAVLILSELLSNACRHGRPLGRYADVGDGDVRAAWHVDRAGGLTVEVTDGGGPTRPVPATPSVTARGGRGLNIISALAEQWGVRDNASSGEVTVWVLVDEGHARVPGMTGPPAAEGITGAASAVVAPSTSTAPGVSTVPGIPMASGVPTTSEVSAVPGVSAVPAVAAVPGVPAVPGFDGLEFLDAFDDAG